MFFSCPLYILEERQGRIQQADTGYYSGGLSCWSGLALEAGFFLRNELNNQAINLVMANLILWKKNDAPIRPPNSNCHRTVAIPGSM